MISRIILFTLLSAGVAAAQDLQKEINEQVWKPFIAGFTNGDTELFMSVHSKDVIRSPRDAKSVSNWDEYYQSMKRGNESRKSRNVRSEIELRFTERIAKGDQGIDVGIYKTTSIDASGNRRSFYGRFHVALRKESGTWKILVDTDSSEGNTIAEKDFESAKPME